MDDFENNNDQNLNNNKSNGLAIAGMVVGIVSICFPFYSIVAIVGLILSILGFNKSKQTNKNKGIAIAGIVCSIIGIIIGIIQIIIVIAAISLVTENADDVIRTIETLNSLNY